MPPRGFGAGLSGKGQTPAGYNVGQSATDAIAAGPAPAPAPARTAATRSSGTARPAPAPAPVSGVSAPASTTAPNTSALEMARQQYGYMRWALDEPELGPILAKAAEEGWDENRLRGAIFNTNWFKTHGTAKVAAQLEEASNDYLMPLSDQTRREWAFKIITNEVQPTEFTDYLKENAKSAFPGLSAAIDRGITLRQYAEPYIQTAARTLEIAPHSVDLMDVKWRRFLDGSRDDKGQPMPMSLSEAERTMKTDAVYGWDRTNQARTQAAQFASTLMTTFGRSA